MIIFLFLNLFGLVILQLFSLNYSIQGLNRVILFSPIEIMYKSIPIFGEPPMFIKSEFENLLNSYYSDAITKYSDDYQISYYFYNADDGSMSLLEKCNGVEITINCKLNLTYQYQRVMYYELLGATSQ